ncbi:MAG: ComEC/Rec2 family competence protein [Patescibacteria group bacterium]
MRAFYFYSIIFGFFAGVFAAGGMQIPLSVFAAIAIVSFAIAAFIFLHSRKNQKDLAHHILICAIFFFAFAIGGARMDFAANAPANDHLNNFLGQVATYKATALDDAGATDASVVVQIDMAKVLLKNPIMEMNYGDKLEISGKLEKPENFKTDQGSEFDYVAYLKKDGIEYIIKNPKIIHKEAGDISLTSILHYVKRKFIANIESAVPMPESSLAAGVTISGKGALPADVKDDFIRAGVIHIVVLSGYNIAVVIAAMMAIFGFMGKKRASAIAMIAVSMFVILSGGAAPVLRSAIMAGIAMIGALSYTPVLQNRALFGAALIMVLWNPLILASDASFALSFLATFAIVNLVKLVEPLLSFMSEKFGIKKVLAETLATQIFVTPYILYQIGRLSIIAPLSNIAILPFIPAIMLLCFIVGVLAFVPFISLPLAGALFILCYVVISLAHIFAHLPFASFDISISLPAMLAMYAGYFAMGYYLQASSKRLQEIS